MDRFKKKFRHETKYLLDERDIVLLENNLRHFMKPDPHSAEGAYQIRSAYFDDYADSAYRQNLDGVSPRSKYRIRIYNGSPEVIFLERKTKDHDMVYKESCRLSKQECGDSLRGCFGSFRGLPGEEEDGADPSKSLYLEFRTAGKLRLLRPAVIVEYEREAYVCEAGNVRVTFDRNLSSSHDLDGFFEKDLHKRPVMPAGKHLLEVKYDEFLPGSIRKSLNLGKLERTSYSKYALCRYFENR